ncbi:uncharacterized protein N7496_001440 [Penicillium cataractarum]|uniref:XPG-I domain-containing protein n=1 Tax=Penicillium cataractarum TaxID=2100454 RepID=A0A9W9VVV1_9EURO|nr:uncharacterized protein N7496_001440 [Penicillium cataractarum]KAJ5390372.1 hypothetical protein N7496_001440 [Penicillium cataractarum]
MGIPGLIGAIGAGERVSLAKVAGLHLERTARPIRIAVDISIWLFQVQASRGGKNPELRTLYFRLLKLLALPVHPLFVYDGPHKPPFKRGKAVSRNSGNLPIIKRSRDLIERFRFPWHEAPGEAEAECARLQQAGIVDAVISNDVDALMFGSTFTMMNFSNESGSGASGATHVTCYHLGDQGYVSNISLDRAGMILFAMLSGGDYLPSGVEKCGPGTAAEIAKAQFGEDLLGLIASDPPEPDGIITSDAPDLDSKLREWRDRLQYELDSNESGYFVNKHPAVRIPENFPDPTILKYYAEPEVSTDEEMAALRHRLKHAWDREIDPLAIRSFAAEFLDWKYRSGARKVIKNLAEPLVTYRLRRQRPVSAISGPSLAPECDTPWLQKVYKSRVSFGTDGMTELQIDMLPIDVVGLDLMKEEPNPPLPSSETEPSVDTAQIEGEEDEAELAADEPQPATSSKARVTKRYDVYAVQKMWVLESVAKLGLPTIVKKWEDEQAEKAKKAAAPKKSGTRRTGPKKKGAIDPGMKRGSILKYGTLTKERSNLSASNKSYLLESASTKQQPALLRALSSSSQVIDLEDDSFTLSMYSQQQSSGHTRASSREVDELIETFSSLTTRPPSSRVKGPPAVDQFSIRSRARPVSNDAFDVNKSTLSAVESVGVQESSNSSAEPSSHSVKSRSSKNEGGAAGKSLGGTSRKLKQKTSNTTHKPDMSSHALEDAFSLDYLEGPMGSLSISEEHDEQKHDLPARSLRKPRLSKADDGTTGRPSQTSPVKTMQASEQALSQKIPLRAQPKYSIKPNQERDKHAIHSKTIASSKKSRATSKDHSMTSLKAEQQTSINTRTKGHIENITILDGFWTVDTFSATGMDPVNSDARQTDTKNDAQSTKNPRRRRVARVSIVDMI